MAYLQIPSKKGRAHHRKNEGGDADAGDKATCRVLNVAPDPNGSRYKPLPEEHQNLKSEKMQAEIEIDAAGEGNIEVDIKSEFLAAEREKNELTVSTKARLRDDIEPDYLKKWDDMVKEFQLEEYTYWGCDGPFLIDDDVTSLETSSSQLNAFQRRPTLASSPYVHKNKPASVDGGHFSLTLDALLMESLGSPSPSLLHTASPAPSKGSDVSLEGLLYCTIHEGRFVQLNISSSSDMDRRLFVDTFGNAVTDEGIFCHDSFKKRKGGFGSRMLRRLFGCADNPATV
ncbi:hypothetical protein DPMN_032965 [Dreissena polymorpha]|uniref:Uncharacterized protein n=1 Tax=Dreissena polymorpha TaxID=45954 RepID=A0A9D4M4Y2_DREPO|nr:hypothetical protein DPMN_032965 [Dreissena polymorpha]